MGLPTAFQIVKLKVSKACEMFLPRGLRLDPKGVSVSWNVSFIYICFMKNTNNNLLKNFLEEHFDFKELKKVGFFDKSIKSNNYEKQAERICEFFGLETIYQYGFHDIKCHISEVNPEQKKPFVTIIKAWHKS